MSKQGRFTGRNVAHTFSRIPELSEVSLNDSITEYIVRRLNRISDYELAINEALMRAKVIDKKLSIRVGPELEIYNIAGGPSFRRRVKQVASAAYQSGEAEDQALGAFEHHLLKDDSFMPKKGRCDNLDQAFFTGMKRANHVHVVPEAAVNQQTSIESYYFELGKEPLKFYHAIFQAEIVSPPRSLQGLAIWLATIGQRVIDRAPEFGLVRSEIVTYLSNVYASALHFHISAIGEKDGKTVNVMARDSFPKERGDARKNPKAVSQLGLHIAHAMNSFLRDYTYIFAPTEMAYKRFADRSLNGTAFIGFCPYRERVDHGSAMFRGEGRVTHRRTDITGKPDTGPLRIELRLPDVGCIGHPNKRAYPDQVTAPFDVVESLVYILKTGVESWVRTRARNVKNDPDVPRTEEALYKMRYDLPISAGAAATQLRTKGRESESFLSLQRANVITARGFRQQEINILDRSPVHPRGQTHDRTKHLTMPNLLEP